MTTASRHAHAHARQLDRDTMGHLVAAMTAAAGLTAATIWAAITAAPLDLVAGLGVAAIVTAWAALGVALTD